jgi:hypothetical protein
LFEINKNTGESVYRVSDLERKQFWGKVPTKREMEIGSEKVPHGNCKKKNFEENKSGRKDKKPYKNRVYKFKVVCLLCKKTVMKQSEKAKYCGKVCLLIALRAKQYAKFKKRKQVKTAIKFYLKLNPCIISGATLPRTERSNHV